MPQTKIYLALGVAAGVFIVDRVLKHLSLTGYLYSSGSWLEFGYSLNTKAVFSLPITNTLALLVGLFIYLGLLICILKYNKTLTDYGYYLIGWWLIMFGGLSNLIDRLFVGGVIDIVNLAYGWFNLADVAIILGAGILLLFYFKKYGR